jgi:hypothetical protein
MVVGAVRRESGSWALLVRGPDRVLGEMDIDGAADPAAAELDVPTGCLPLALRFEFVPSSAGETSLACTCLVTDEGGPRWIGLSAPAALALVDEGIHGTVAAPAAVAVTSRNRTR